MLVCRGAVDNGGDSFSAVGGGAMDGGISGTNGVTASVDAGTAKRQGIRGV